MSKACVLIEIVAVLALAGRIPEGHRRKSRIILLLTAAVVTARLLGSLVEFLHHDVGVNILGGINELLRIVGIEGLPRTSHQR